MSTASTDFDTLADLFLNDGALGVSATRIGPAPVKPLASRPAPSGPGVVTVFRHPVEAILLGHLPVSAAAWVVPFARQRSHELKRPVALLRLDHGDIALDVVAPTSAQLTNIPGEFDCLDEAVKAVAPHVGAWILKVSEIAEPETVSSSAIASVSVLTGADEVATANTFRTLKRLAPRPEGTSLRVAIMGATKEAAAHADAQIRTAVETFGDCELAPACVIERVNSGGLRPVFSGPAERDLAALIASLESVKISPPPATVIEAKAPAIRLVPADSASPERQSPRPPQSAAASAAQSSTLENLKALSTRCPYAPEVDLSVDAGGELHLAVRTGTGTPFLDPGMGVQRLLTAASWVADHAQLLAAVHGDLKAEAAMAGPALHLMTDEPKSVRRLLDTGVRVHLVVDAETSAGSIKICRDLN